MDERILVEVDLPIVQLHLDVYLPEDATINQLVAACLGYIKEVHRLFQQDQVLVYHSYEQKILPQELIVKNSNLHNGSRIILL